VGTNRVGRPLGQSDFLEANEVMKILSLPKRNTKEGLRDYAILLVFSNTPMRKGEVISLKVENLVNNGGYFIEYVVLKKRKSKTKKSRRVSIPISREVYVLLQRYLKSEYRNEAIKPDSPLFRTLGKHGPYAKGPLTAKAVDLLVHKYGRLSGIKKRITPHTFRSTYLTLRLDEGHSPPNLARFGLSRAYWLNRALSKNQ